MFIYCHSKLDHSLREKLTQTLNEQYTIEFGALLDLSTAQDAFKKADYILGNPPLEWFDHMPVNLKFWQLDSAGFDQYAQLSIPSSTLTANMGDWFARPCAESIVAGIAALYRGIDQLTLLKQKAEWQGINLRTQLLTLYKQNVIILGAGTIGQAVQSILEGYGCHVDLLAKTSPKATIFNRNDLILKLPTTDLVINALPGNVVHFVDSEFLYSMKKGSVYASVGRGSTTDEVALLDALNSNHLSGAVLDVTEIEPLPVDNPLWKMNNVILTQHTGGGQKGEHVGKVDLFLNNIFALENGSAILNKIQINKGY
jgi:glyoxylate/hydroxypyruvate reductase A